MRGLIPGRILALLLPWLACACTNAFDEPGTVRHFEEGGLCVRSAGTGDAPLEVTVTFSTCLSSSCDRAIAQECRVVVEGNHLRVDAHAAVRSEGEVCTADCGSLHAECASEPLAPGAYTVEHAGQVAPLNLPAAPAVQLFEDSGLLPCQ